MKMRQRKTMFGRKHFNIRIDSFQLYLEETCFAFKKRSPAILKSLIVFVVLATTLKIALSKKKSYSSFALSASKPRYGCVYRENI